MKIHSGRYLILALLISTSCSSGGPPLFDGSELSRGRGRHKGWADLGSVTPPPPDLGEAPAPDLGTAPAPDLAGPPAPADMSSGGTGAYSVAGVAPSSGPLGSLLTVSGTGFQSGDAVQISSSSLSALTLVTLSLSAGAITAELPSSGVSPESVQVRVKRGTQALPSGGEPFQITAGHVYYISPSGSDSASGSKSSPWATITKADQVLQPGDVVYLRGGTYNGPFTLHASGTASAPLAFRAYPGERALLDRPSGASGNIETLTLYGNYMVIDGLHITNHLLGGTGVALEGSHDTFENSEIFGATRQGMILDGQYNLIYRSSIHDIGNATFYLYHSHGIYVESGNNIFRSNLIYNNQTNGVQLYNGYGTLTPGNLFEYNYIFHNGWLAQATPSTHSYAGIIVSDGNSNTTIRKNILCGNAQYGVLVQQYSGVPLTGNVIDDNVTCYNGYGGLYVDEQPASMARNISYNDSGFTISTINGVTSDYDVFYGSAPLQWNGSSLSLSAFRSASGQEAHGKIADPMFTKVGSAFDPTSAASYNFCTPLNSAFCQPLP